MIDAWLQQDITRPLQEKSQELGVSLIFWGPNNEDYNILGSILGSPYFGKLPVMQVNTHKAHEL